MKFLSFLLILSFNLFADTTDTKSFTYTGDNHRSIELNTEVTRTEYRTQRVRSTCYRTELQRRCYNERYNCRQVCQNGRCRNVCNTRRVCRNVQVQRPYTCWVYRQVPVQVFDHYRSTSVDFNFINNSTTRASENFVLTQRGKNYNLKLKSSGNFLVKLYKDIDTTENSGDTVFRTISYTAILEDISLAKSALGNGINKVQISNSILSFNMGKGFNLNDFSLNLKLFRYKRIGRDVLVFNNDIKDIAILEDKVNYIKVTIDLNQLGVTIPFKKRIIINSEYLVDLTDVINEDQVKTKASGNWIFR